MKRWLMISGFVIFFSCQALCALFFFDHDSACEEFSYKEKAEKVFRNDPESSQSTGDHDADGPDGSHKRGKTKAINPLFALKLVAGESSRINSFIGLSPDFNCRESRLSFEMIHLLPQVFEKLHVQWIRTDNGKDRGVKAQSAANAHIENELTRRMEEFTYYTEKPVKLGVTAHLKPLSAEQPSLECWSLRIFGRKAMTIRTRDIGALVGLPLSLAVLLAGMWMKGQGTGQGRTQGKVKEAGIDEASVVMENDTGQNDLGETGLGETGKKPDWKWADALVPLVLCASAFMVFLAPDLLGLSLNRELQLLLHVPLFTVFGLIPALVAARRRTHAPLEALGGHRGGWARSGREGRGWSGWWRSGHAVWIAIAAALGFALACGSRTLLIETQPDPLPTCRWGVKGILVLAMISSSAALWEEVFFRGLIYEVVASKTDVFTASLISALLFAAAHISGRTPWAFGWIVALAIILTLLRLKTKSLVVCITLHAVYNLSLLLFTAIRLY